MLADPIVHPENESLKSTLKQFSELERALIDTSSIIYLSRLKSIETLGQTIELFTIAEIEREYGLLPYPLKLISGHLLTKRVDDKLIFYAKDLNMALISEDKQILRRCNKLDLAYFNTLMMLQFMLFKKVLNQNAYDELYAHLKSFARYSPKVWAYGSALRQAVQNNV